MNNSAIKRDIIVKVPVFWGQHIFIIRKGSPWSAIDHLLLKEISLHPLTATQLAIDSNLPRQLIIEIMIPLLKAGWAQLVQSNSGYAFEATSLGQRAASFSKLPAVQKTFLSSRSFIIDPNTDQCMRINEKLTDRKLVQVYRYMRAQDLTDLYHPYLIELTPNRKSIRCNPAVDEIFQVVREAEEEVIGFADTEIIQYYEQNTRYIFTRVSEDNEIQGLPVTAPDELKDYIIRAAKEKRNELEGNPEVISTTSSKFESEYLLKPFVQHTVSIDQYHLILGSKEHRDHLFNMIDQARTRLIIHSTFINTGTEIFPEILEHLILAAKRNIRIDVLWGQNDPESNPQTVTETKIARYQKTIESLKIVNQRIASEGLQTRFTIHLEPTQSHAKIIVCDHVTLGFVASIGSCNWLASGFYRFEASVSINYGPIVVEALSILSRLAKGLSKVSTALSIDLARMANQVRRQNKKFNQMRNDRQSILLQLIAQDKHHGFVRQARDEAQEKVFLCSHRMSHNQDRPILAPLETLANQDSAVGINLFYGIASGNMTNPDAIEMQTELANSGIDMKWINRRGVRNLPEFHAKILSWDDNDAVVTSLNWLSAQAVGDDLGEIGVYIHGDKVADKINTAFNQFIAVHLKEKKSK